ncbi:MAG: M48 family metallopeptidase [Bacteroidales bacterium]|nr:M48 family metallopeptidase [Bacteroidales bacterium]
MKYVGIHTQQVRNNVKSILLLCCFPLIVIGMVWIFFALLEYFGTGRDPYGNPIPMDWDEVNEWFVQFIPIVLIVVSVWFLIAYIINDEIIRHATQAVPLKRKDNMRVYNIVENLCMAGGMNMPKVYVVEDPQLNAYASGISENTYAVTVTRGLLNKLNDEELAGVIGHELTHIRNRDTRVLIVSIVFVGIFSMVAEIAFRMFLNSGSRRSNNSKGNSFLIGIVIAAVLAFIAYIFALLTRFAISRKREFMADAGGAELCGNPLALASALRKISNDPGLNNVSRADVAQLFIERPKKMEQGFFESAFSELFSTHPDTKKRIAYLEQF